MCEPESPSIATRNRSNTVFPTKTVRSPFGLQDLIWIRYMSRDDPAKLSRTRPGHPSLSLSHSLLPAPLSKTRVILPRSNTSAQKFVTTGSQPQPSSNAEMGTQANMSKEGSERRQHKISSCVHIYKRQYVPIECNSRVQSASAYGMLSYGMHTLGTYVSRIQRSHCKQMCWFPIC